MKNLIAVKPKTTHFAIYEWIVASRQNLTNDRLKTVRLLMENRYRLYEEKYKLNDLLSIPVQIFNPEIGDLLSSCYGQAKNVDSLKEKIRSIQERDLQGICQYCGLGKPETIDHYLPQSNFPEYSVLALNLFPCCQKCNGKKLNYWKKINLAGQEIRGVINFYLDDIASKRFLYVNLTYENEVPVIKFFIENRNGIEDYLYEIIEAHFERLELIKRYEDEANDLITSLISQIAIYNANTSIQELKECIIRDVQDTQKRLGINCWKAVLKEVLADSNQFLKDIKNGVTSYVSNNQNESGSIKIPF